MNELVVDDRLTERFNQEINHIPIEDLVNIAFDRDDIIFVDLENDETKPFEYVQIGIEIGIKLHQLKRQTQSALASPVNVYQFPYDGVVFYIFAVNEDQLMKIVSDLKRECES